MKRNPKQAASSYRPSRGRAERLTLGVALAGAFLALGLAGTGHAVAADSSLSLSKQWMRMIIPQRPAAGYFTLTNNGDTAVDLTGASSPGCGMVMLHKSVRENGVDKMVHVEGVAVPAHQSISFAPGGYHLMCMKPTADVTPGKSVPVTLKFKDGATLSADFPVRNARGE